MNIRNWLHSAVVVIGALTVLSAQAAKVDAQAEMKAATEAAQAAAKEGPLDIPLKDQATLKLPAGFIFVPQPAAGQLLKAMGNGDDPERLGIIYPADSKAQWFVVPRYIDSGYIKDDEAKDWKADEMLKQFKEGTEASNQERVDRGIPEMEIIGWVQSPKYDANSHRLVWSMESKNKGAPDTEERGINYNTYVLGREGYVSMNLVTGKSTIESDKESAHILLANTSFNPGRTYADFNSSTDRVAEYGIAALVAGAAAKKLGLFAVIAAFLAKFAKVFAVAGFAAAAGLAQFFKNRKKTDQA